MPAAVQPPCFRRLLFGILLALLLYFCAAQAAAHRAANQPLRKTLRGSHMVIPSGKSGNRPTSPSSTSTALAALSTNPPQQQTRAPARQLLANSSSAAAAAAPGSNSSGGGVTFPGYPQSGGLLRPELSPLLLAIQEAHLYNDSKTAVDLVMSSSPADTLAAYQQLLAGNSSSSAASNGASSNTSSAGAADPSALQAFVTTHTQPAGSDMLTCQPPDWVPEPPGFLSNLQAGSNDSTAAPGSNGTTAAADSTAAAGSNDSTATAGASAGSTGAASGGSTAAGGGDSTGASLPSNATELRQFGLKLHGLWRLLCRKVSPAVFTYPERHSLLPSNYSTIVPGDRFRETYYWDSYWVIRGLLVSGMRQSATSLVGNLLTLLEAVGHVPNGARVYYINRSQPPLLSAMVRIVYEADAAAAAQAGSSTATATAENSTATVTNTSSSNSSSQGGNGTMLLRRALPLLLVEHQYWTSAPKAVTVQAADGTTHSFSRYYANWTSPRPESYREDASLARNVTGTSSPDNPAAAALYRELASGAESGWDYSSRWFADNKTLGTIRTTQVIPADLNAFLYQMEENIAWAAEQLDDSQTQQRFETLAQSRRNSINKVLWDNEAGMWRDGILQPLSSSNSTATNSSNSSSGNSSSGGSSGNSGSTPSNGSVYTLVQNPGVFASNYVPLWSGVAGSDIIQGSRVVESLTRSGLVGPAGIGTTLYATGQQWDWPNGWPPLQHMLIEGARRYGGNPGQEFACSMARTWLGVNLAVFNATGTMHEKYNVTQAGVGGGGEYSTQVGFGWSNGVALDLLATYC